MREKNKEKSKKLRYKEVERKEGNDAKARRGT